jgi:hypothetical protein
MATPCLDETLVVAFCAGKATPAQIERIEAHVDTCKLCLDLIAFAAKAGAELLELGGGAR